MTNWFDNVVYLTRHTSMTPSAIDDLSWFEYEMYLKTLKEQLDSEELARKKMREREQRKQQRQSHSSPINNMYNQMKSWLSGRHK